MGTKKYPVIITYLLLCAALLCGCGRSLVITTGFGRNEVFRLGKEGCKVAEVRVCLLDLQKQSQALYGTAIWDGEDSGDLQEAVREQALAQITRVKALNQIGISRNIMLSNDERDRAEKAEYEYYAALSEEEKKYIGLDENNLQRMFREYALAQKTWKSLGDSAEEVYEEFCESTQCDLNTPLWQNVSLQKVEGDPDAPGFAQCYSMMFAEEEEEAAEAKEGEQGEGE